MHKFAAKEVSLRVLRLCISPPLSVTITTPCSFTYHESSMMLATDCVVTLPVSILFCEFLEHVKLAHVPCSIPDFQFLHLCSLHYIRGDTRLVTCAILRLLKPHVHVSDMHKFSSYLPENTRRHQYEDQSDNVVQANQKQQLTASVTQRAKSTHMRHCLARVSIHYAAAVSILCFLNCRVL